MLKKIGLFAGLWLITPYLLAATEYRGLIFKTDLEGGIIQIDSREHRITVGKTEVFYKKRPVGVSTLEKDMFVRYLVDSNNQVEAVWIIGPDQKIQQILSH